MAIPTEQELKETKIGLVLNRISKKGNIEA